MDTARELDRVLRRERAHGGWQLRLGHGPVERGGRGGVAQGVRQRVLVDAVESPRRLARCLQFLVVAVDAEADGLVRVDGEGDDEPSSIYVSCHLQKATSSQMGSGLPSPVVSRRSTRSLTR